MAADLMTGPSGMPLDALSRAFWARPNGEDRTAAAILWQIRMPQTLMALLATGLIYLVARIKGSQAEVLVLAGIAVLFFFQALQSLVQFMASPEVLQQIVFWLFGSLLKSSWTSVQVSGTILALCLPFVLQDAWNLTALRLAKANLLPLAFSCLPDCRKSVPCEVCSVSATSSIDTSTCCPLPPFRLRWNRADAVTKAAVMPVA